MKKPLKSSVSKGICVSRSRLCYIVTAASLGCMGRSSAQNYVLQQPSGYDESNRTLLVPAPHIAAYLVFFSLGGNFTSLLLAFKVTEFPYSPQNGKKELLLLKHLSLAAWDIKPSSIWANTAFEKIAMIGSTVVLETVSRRMTLPDCDSHCPFLYPFCVMVPSKVEPELCFLPPYLLPSAFSVQLGLWSFNDYSVRENLFTLSKCLCSPWRNLVPNDNYNIEISSCVAFHERCGHLKKWHNFSQRCCDLWGTKPHANCIQNKWLDLGPEYIYCQEIGKESSSQCP